MNLEQYEYDFSEQEQPVGPGDNFWLDGKSLAIAFCRAIPERMADLLEVAMSVYASDRRSLQDYRGANTGHRRIRIRLGVRDPRFWSRREMHDRLTTPTFLFLRTISAGLATTHQRTISTMY